MRLEFMIDEEYIKNKIKDWEIIDNISIPFQYDTHMNTNKELPSWIIEEVDGRIIGISSIFAINGYEGEVSVAVDPQFRNQGIGTSLIKMAMETLKNHKYQKMLLLWEERNDVTKSFCEKRFSYDHGEISLKWNRVLIPITENVVEIVEATIDDIPQMARISVEAFEDSYDFAVKYLTSIFENEKRKPYIAKISDKTIGIVVIGISDQISINGLGLENDSRGKGYGKAFMLGILDILKVLNKDIILDVDKENTVAYNLYKDLGFEEISITNYSFLDI
jgi:ribosomal protein S18 acetylase RimI-like enzyme